LTSECQRSGNEHDVAGDGYADFNEEGDSDDEGSDSDNDILGSNDKGDNFEDEGHAIDTANGEDLCADDALFGEDEKEQRLARFRRRIRAMVRLGYDRNTYA
jgi:hypothetical protein